MAGVDFKFKVYGEDAINRTMVGYMERVTDWRPAFKMLRVRFWEMEQKQFETQGAAGGNTWAQLATKTVKAKARHRQHGKILVATERLKKSLTVFGAKGAVSRLSRTSMYVGSTIDYGRYHQKGTSGGHIQRKVIQFTEVEKREWIKILQGYLHAQALMR